MSDEQTTTTPNLESLLLEEEQQLDEFLNTFRRWLLGRPKRFQGNEGVMNTAVSLLHQVENMQRTMQNLRSHAVDVGAEREQILGALSTIKRALRRIQQKSQ